MFESVDRHMADSSSSNPISLPGAFGSGKPKIIDHKNNANKFYIIHTLFKF